MKQNLLNSLRLRLCMLVALFCTLSTSVWADDVASFSRSGSSNTTSGGTFTTTFSGKSGYYQDNNGTCYMQIKSSTAYWTTTPSSITLTSKIGGGSANRDLTNNVYAVLLDSSGNEISSSATSITSHITTNTGDTYTTSIPVTNNVYGIKIYHAKENGYNVRYFSFSLSYVSGGDGPSLTTSNLTITNQSTALSFDLYNNSSSQVINYTTSSTGAITIEPASPTSYFSYVHDATNKTITVTPLAVTSSAQTVTISQEADDTYEAGSVTFTVNVTDSTPLPTHTATFSVNGTTSTQDFEEGAAITFPSNPEDISGKSFVGWTTATISGTTNTAPTPLVTSANMGNADVTYYAVFAEATGSTEESWTETAIGSLTSSDVFVIVGYNGDNYAMSNDNGTQNAPSAIKVTVDNGVITLASMSGKTNIQWNISGNATDGYKFYPNGLTDTWLYCINDNNGVRVGSTKENYYDLFEIRDNYIYNKGRARYLGVYNGSNWRCYTSINNNISGQTFKFYKYIAPANTYSNYCTSVIVKYSLTYDANGATSGDVPTDATTYSPNDLVTVLGNTGNLAKTGYIFGGWNTQQDGEGTHYSADETFNITANTTLYAKWTPKTIVNLSYTGTLSKTEYYAGESFDPTGLTVTATFNDESSDDVTESVTWTPDPMTVGVTSVTGTYMGLTVTVNGLTVTIAPGSEGNPYTVAQAIAATPSSGNVYIHGIVSAFYNTSIVGDGSNYRYYISDDGNTTTQLLVYRGKGLNEATFNSAEDLQIGDEVTIYGALTTYNNAPEVASGNYLVSRSRKLNSDLAITSSKSVELERTSSEMNPNSTITWTTSSNGAMSFVSSDTNVATVESESGVITAQGEGTATITISQAADEDYKASENIEVTVIVTDNRSAVVTGLGLPVAQQTLTVGDIDDFAAIATIIEGFTGTVSYTYASSNESIVELAGETYEAKTPGTATITITATPTGGNAANYKPATQDVVVTVKGITTLALSSTGANEDYGTPISFTATVADGYDGTLTVTSNREAVAKASIEGTTITVTSQAVGTATITVTAPATDLFNGEVSKTFEVEYVQPEGGTKAYLGTATTATISFASNDIWALPTDYATTAASYSDGTYTISLAAGTTGEGWKWNADATNGNYLIMGKKNATLTLPAFDKAVTQIDVVGKTGASGKVIQNIFVGEYAVSDATTGATGTNEYVINENYQNVGTIYTLKVTSEHNTQITSIVVHFAATPLTVTLNKSGYATYCSQYPLDFSEATDYSAWQITSIDGSNNITFEKVTGSVKGGTGLFLVGEDNATITLTSVDSENELSDNLLEGTMAPMYFEANTIYGLAGNTFKKNIAGTIKANKAYLPANLISTVSSARAFTFVFVDPTTGITETQNVSAEEFGAIFNLAGQRVSQPQRGVNIINGKKVLVK